MHCMYIDTYMIQTLILIYTYIDIHEYHTINKWKMDHNHLKKERGTWPVSILPALQSIDSNGNQSHLCCKLLYMCSTLLDVNNSGHTTTQSGIGNFMCCHFVPRTSEPLETRLMESGIHLQCPSCTPTWKWTPGISYTEFLAACLEDRSSPLSQGFFLRWTTHDHTARRDTTRRKLRFGMLSGSIWYTAFWSFQLSRWFFGLGEDSELLFFVTKAYES